MKYGIPDIAPNLPQFFPNSSPNRLTTITYLPTYLPPNYLIYILFAKIITLNSPNYYPNYYPKKSKLLDDLFMMIICLENIYYFFFQDSKMKKNKKY